MLEACAKAPPAVRATELIAAVALSLGDAAPVTAGMARQLTVGDRERVLLACAAATLGDEVDAVAHCPECEELVELAVPVRDLIGIPAGGIRSPEHELQERTAGGIRRLRYRLPTGADLEEAAQAARASPDLATTTLLARCVLQVSDGDGKPVPGPIGPELATALDQAVADLDPAAEAIGEGRCPACGAVIHGILDGFALLASGLASGDRLQAEVDSLARAYHGSEAEILALPVPRRRRYLDLVYAGTQT
jgi:hypothetical protein